MEIDLQIYQEVGGSIPPVSISFFFFVLFIFMCMYDLYKYRYFLSFSVVLSLQSIRVSCIRSLVLND